MEFVTYEVENRIGYITLNRPEKRNALSPQLISELQQAFTRASEDATVKVVVLKANGKVFCAGADLAYIQTLQTNTFEENLEDSMHLRNLFYKIYTMGKVVIAQVHGHAIAGGCGLASICDFVYSAPEAKYGYTEVKIGFIPALVKVFLLRKLGETRVKELLLSGDLITADRAETIGLITEVVAAEELEGKVNQLAEHLCKQNSGDSMAFTKKMIAEIPCMSIEDGLNYAAQQNARARATEDCKKGIAGFLNKESVTW
ncbi:MAG TPA: methylglutaconyl-CoA hydratase [Cytophagales bacterium]|nr:methylglutaconyl-CoA hydratase [Cytophagales bacterium]HAA19355.1 methylglutaconyl-CoA hydratase [Cytophagales bacterium]HAP64963.1 methylglutaconyl-CoA hydratase [Cytophagales bacterium]